MPDARGNFRGQGWSRKKELSWERIFAPKSTLTDFQKEVFVKHVGYMKP